MRNSQLGVRCTRVMDGWTLPPDFEDDGAAAEAARRAFGVAHHGGGHARNISRSASSSASATRPRRSSGRTADAAPPDSWDTYTPLDRPGARAPHFWLAPERAAYDEFGKGFTLHRFRRAAKAPARCRAAARARGVPLKTLRLEPPDGLYRSKLVLIRPDQHIAWHGDAVADATAVIDRVRGA